MKTIWKFDVNDDNNELPFGYKILCAKSQHGDDVTIWAEVDTDAHLVDCCIEVFGTGHELKEDMGTDRRYIDTVMLDTGLVFHVYERIS